MRFYASAWRTSVDITVAGLLVFSWLDIGWLPTLGAITTLACFGVLFGVGWLEGSRPRRRVIAGCAVWFTRAGVLALWLPQLIGPWSLLVLAGLVLSCPPVLGVELRACGKSRPARSTGSPGQIPGHDFDRRWRETSAELSDPSLRPAAALALVEERAALLDELERRDPDAYLTGLGLWGSARRGAREG